eukprot:371058-Hanusia_phi.AAC.1
MSKHMMPPLHLRCHTTLLFSPSSALPPLPSLLSLPLPSLPLPSLLTSMGPVVVGGMHAVEALLPCRIPEVHGNLREHQRREERRGEERRGEERRGEVR